MRRGVKSIAFWPQQHRTLIHATTVSLAFGARLPPLPNSFAKAAMKRATINREGLADADASKSSSSSPDSVTPSSEQGEVAKAPADAEMIASPKNQAAIAIEKGKHASKDFEDGKLETAARLWEEAIKKLEKNGYADSPLVIPPMNNLACVYGELGFTRCKLQLSERCVALVEHCYGKKHPQYVIALSNLGDVEGELSNYERKRELLTLAMKTQIELGKGKEDSAKVARCKIALADAERKLGNAARARELLGEALTVVERHCGPVHPQTAVTYSELALACVADKDPFTAKEHYKQALEIEEKFFGVHHPQLCANLCRLSTVDSEKRKEHLDRALDLLKRNSPKTDLRPSEKKEGEVDLGPPVSFPSASSRDWMLHLRQYAKVLSEYSKMLNPETDMKQKFTLAMDAYQVALRCYPPGHQFVAELMVNVAGLHRKKGSEQDAQRWAHRGEKILISVLGEQNTSVIDAHPVILEARKYQ